MAMFIGCLMIGPHAWAADAGQAGDPSPASGSPDPFGGGDPFALVNDQHALPPGAADTPRKAGHRPNAQTAVFLKEYYVGINEDSRINPDNRIQALRDNYGVVETRMTLSDRFDSRQALRWLFKGYASTTSIRDTDNVLDSQARVDELFVDGKDGNLFASIGKRRINWGYAQGFNAVNVIAPPRDPLNPDYETEGQPLIWLSRSGSVTTDVILTRNYDRNWSSDQNRWAVKLGMSPGDSSFSLYYFDGRRYPDGRDFERMLGASFSTNLVAGLTLYADAASFSHNYRNYYRSDGSAFRKDESYFQGVTGVSLDLGGKSSVFLEYFRNHQGYTVDERRNYLATADLRLATATDKALLGDFIPLSMNTKYLLAGYKKEYRDNYNFNLSAMLAEDGSISMRGEVDYALTDYYELRVSYLRNTGDGESEFGNNPYASLLEVGFNASF